MDEERPGAQGSVLRCRIRVVRTGLAEKKDPSTDFQGRGTEPRGCYLGGGWCLF